MNNNHYNDSPYAAPDSTVLDLENDQIDVIPASKGTRFLNVLIDYVGFSVFSIVVGLALGLIWGEAAVELLEKTPEIVTVIIIFFVYYLSQEILFNRTLGKLVTGTTIVNAEGRKPARLQIIGRTFARMIPFEPFSFFGKTGRGWHDSLSGTYVVKRL
jgi:uncharacterized RDD family membrane protein YckC